ncbi:MAG: hypothetical protein LBR24_01235 [Methanobrevibacter sp.]|jgi:UDP-N-acetylmuramate-alanine ligase|nr:hypothetical protein [Methanobrevibacter sp.]
MANKLLLLLAIYVGKAIFFGLNLLGRTGTALPGNIALRIYPDILKEMSGRCAKIAIITGTNGKTTTNNLINHILWGKYSSIVSNLKGANMVQGVVTGFVVNFKNSYDWGIFEVDEGSVPVVSRYLTADYIVITNFFRDQLDRFGEVDNTIKMVYDSLKDTKTKIIVNADDPSNQKFSQLPNEKIY